MCSRYCAKCFTHRNLSSTRPVDHKTSNNCLPFTDGDTEAHIGQEKYPGSQVGPKEDK